MTQDANSSPLAFFGTELRRLRDKAGMTQTRLAELTSYSLPSVSAFETGRRIPPPEFSVGADKALDTDGTLERLQGLVEQLSVLPWFRDRIEVERTAIEIREYESYQIPGLLQTEDYARTVISAGRPAMASDAIERAVALRLTRQQILEPDINAPIDRDHKPRLWAILDEAALCRVVGGSAIMAAQLDHLISMAQQPSITIQVIPNSGRNLCLRSCFHHNYLSQQRTRHLFGGRQIRKVYS